MARTYRRRLHWPDWDTPVLDTEAPDRKPRCWCCGGVKRYERRRARAAAKATLRRDPDHA